MLMKLINWKNELCESFCSVEELEKILNLSHEEIQALKKVTDIHPMQVTRYYLSLINPDDPDDPIKKMIIPSIDELNIAGTYDTSGEKSNTKLIGLQHKYQQTALILTTSQCSAYCRYCFRKRFVGVNNKEIVQNLNEAIKYIEKNEQINNVLLSGGDSLMLDTVIIKDLLDQLSNIKHLSFIRFGTKIPVVFPDRILGDESLLKLFQEYSTYNRKIYVVTQFNHPKELTDKAIEGINRLLECNVIINNQTILMKDVNDDPDILARLLNQLTGIGVTPYYVFQCRPVKRVMHHFQVPIKDGIEVVEKAKRQLNGCSKRFKYVMSHKTGKIEILGRQGKKTLFKYHQAKNPDDCGVIFQKKLKPDQGWLRDDFHI